MSIHAATDPRPALAPQPAPTSRKDPAPRHPRLSVLDGLRLVAATMVVAHHWIGKGVVSPPHQGKIQAWGRLTTQVFPAPLHHLAAYGWLGVELFFLVSGFVICMSAWGRSGGDFARSRIVRLFPAYWASVLLTAAVLTFLPALGVKLGPGSLSEILLNLTMVHGAYGVSHVDSVYWTLWVELCFYLLFSIVVAIGLTYRRVVLFCALWAVGALLAAKANEPTLQVIFQPQYAPYFIAGIAFYLIRRFGATLLLYGIVGFSFLLAQYEIRQAAASNIGDLNWKQMPTWPCTLALIGFFALMALVAHGKLDWIRGRWLIAAGALTYPLYLLHQNIGFTAIAYLRGKVDPLVLITTLYACLLLVCYLMHRLIERPGGRWLNNQLNHSLTALRHNSSREQR